MLQINNNNNNNNNNNCNLTAVLCFVDGGPGAEKAGLPLPHQLCQDTAGPCNHGCQHICKSKFSPPALPSPPQALNTCLISAFAQ